MNNVMLDNSVPYICFMAHTVPYSDVKENCLLVRPKRTTNKILIIACTFFHQLLGGENKDNK